MTLYTYRAIDRTGAAIDGEMEAADRHTVLDQLSRNGSFAVDVAVAADRKSNGERPLFSLRGEISKDTVTVLTRELAMLLQAGLTLDQALALLEQDQPKSRRAKLIGRLRFALSEGRSFADALETQGRAFPPIYTNMVRVAEATGTLQSVLEQIADARERQQKLRSKILSASLYPMFLIASAVAMVLLLLGFVIPRFKVMIAEAGAAVPDAASLIIAASDGLIANWQLLGSIVLTSVLACLLLWGRPWFRAALDRILLRLPLIGSFVRLNLSVRLCRTLGTLLASGVDLPDALSLCRRVVATAPAAKALDEAHDALRKGQDFITPLSASRLFPSVMINMLKVGQETGNLAPSARYLADMFEDKLDLRVQRTMTILEPTIILLVAGFVAGIIIAILGAVISVNDIAL